MKSHVAKSTRIRGDRQESTLHVPKDACHTGMPVGGVTRRMMAPEYQRRTFTYAAWSPFRQSGVRGRL